MKKTLVACVLLLIFSQQASSQYYSSGQDPTSIKWKQINTAGFKVIFPEGYEKTANYVANVLEYARMLDSTSLKANPKKVPVVLHNRSTISNAQSLWAPRRMDFYTVPPQDTYGQEWFQQLALHEYRHQIQLTKLNQGLTKLLTYLFGQQVTAAVFGLYVPLWFVEGDAVAAETGLSQTGRGRTPSFTMPVRAQVLDKKIYSYDKAVFGSYKDFIPNRYELGYQLVSQGRKTFGTGLWNHTIDNVGKNPWMVVPFSQGIKKVTGMNKTGFYNFSMNQLKAGWEQQNAENEYYDILNKIIPEKKFFTNYLRPHFTENSTIVAEKRALNDLARFVEMDEHGNETTLFTPGFYDAGSLTYANEMLAWTEHKYDLRWQNQDFSVIKTYDLQTKAVKILNRRSRWFAPDLSPDASKTVAVEVSENQEFRMVILETATGNILKQIALPGNGFITWPAWSEDGKSIVFVAVGDKGKCLALARPETGKVELLTDFTFTEISKPVMFQNQVYFVGAWSGVDNLFCLDLKTRDVSMVSGVKYGTTDPQISSEGKTLLFSNYTADGFIISQLSLAEKTNIPLSLVSDNSDKLFQTLAQQEGKTLEPGKISAARHEIRNYSKLSHLFNFHSWGPVSVDAGNTEINPGVSLMSQNVLSTAFTTLGYKWDMNEETGKYYLNFSYEGWYPVLDFQADYGKRESYTFDTAENRVDFSWMETNFSSNVRIPFNLTSGKYSRTLQHSIGLNYTQLDMDPEAPVRFKRSNYKTINQRLYYYSLMKTVDRDMYPKWGQIVDLMLRTAPFEGDTLGSMFGAQTRLFFPGLFRHHSLNFYLGYQKRLDNSTYYGNMISYPRGYTGQYSDELASFAVNYKFPVLYPDFSLSSLFYLKRLKANLFFDHAEGLHKGFSTIYNSTGIDLVADVHVLRFVAPLELGCRLVYLPKEQSFTSQFLFSVNFSSF